eukprot:TRINITY_DN67419_c14_g1_i1.p1 TRINITY_DN67419_c14_g1~~TRINITY_DN67419_c14_g1_i1.p1  ORF type:complete len:269 (+),score=29.98 TRINITY_DN67419_c14_g1_i1:82-888(+)
MVIRNYILFVVLCLQISSYSCADDDNDSSVTPIPNNCFSASLRCVAAETVCRGLGTTTVNDAVCTCSKDLIDCLRQTHANCILLRNVDNKSFRDVCLDQFAALTDPPCTSAVCGPPRPVTTTATVSGGSISTSDDDDADNDIDVNDDDINDDDDFKGWHKLLVILGAALLALLCISCLTCCALALIKRSKKKKIPSRYKEQAGTQPAVYYSQPVTPPMLIATEPLSPIVYHQPSVTPTPDDVCIMPTAQAIYVFDRNAAPVVAPTVTM